MLENPSEVLEKVPALTQTNLTGAVRYFDGFTNDARLTLDDIALLLIAEDADQIALLLVAEGPSPLLGSSLRAPLTESPLPRGGSLFLLLRGLSVGMQELWPNLLRGRSVSRWKKGEKNGCP